MPFHCVHTALNQSPPRFNFLQSNCTQPPTAAPTLSPTVSPTIGNGTDDGTDSANSGQQSGGLDEQDFIYIGAACVAVALLSIVAAVAVRQYKKRKARSEGKAAPQRTANNGNEEEGAKASPSFQASRSNSRVSSKELSLFK